MAEYREVETPGGDTPSATGESKGGFWSWVVGIFTEPTATFDSISQVIAVPDPTESGKTKDKSKWWIAIVIFAVILAITTAYVMLSPQGAEMMREQMLEAGVPAESLDETVQMARTVGLPVQIVAIVIFVFVIAFIGAAIIHLFSKMFGGKGLFRHARAIACWGLLIPALGTLVKIPIMAVTGKMMVETSPSIFFSGLEPGDTLFKFLNAGFDVFVIWETVVVLLGVAVMYRLTKGKAAAVALLSWAIATAVLTFLVPQGGSFGGM
jgi:hypothetical protein